MRIATRLTGLSADTIRVWERRYGAIEPSRTAGKARRYSGDEIRRLSLLRDAIAQGHTISAIANLSEQNLRELVSAHQDGNEPLHTGDSRWNVLIEDYLRAIERYDLRRADELLARTAALASPRDVALRLMAPLLREIGERWADDTMSVAQEHVASGQCRALLGALLRNVVVDAGAPRILLGAPPGHQHDLGLMIGAVLASARGLLPIHLGPDVPWTELREAAATSKADVILLAIERDLSDEEQESTVRELNRLGKERDVWLGLPARHALVRESLNVRMMHDFGALDTQLALRFG